MGSRQGQVSSRTRREVVGQEQIPITFIERKESDTKVETRLNVLDEILNTEKAYLNDIRVIVDKYLVPLRKEKILPSEVLPKIFSNVEWIAEFHESLYNQLAEKISDIRYASSIEYCMSEIFSTNAANMENYVTFSTNYKSSLQEVQLQADRHPNFAAFLERQQKEDPVNLRLIDYLIKPIQRLCKYPLIFRELLKNTPSDHKDRRFMEETMYCLEKLTNHVNECNLAAENEEKLLDVASTLTGLDIPFVICGRRFLKDGTVYISVDKERYRLRRFIIVSDMIIIAKPKTKKLYQFLENIESDVLLFVPEAVVFVGNDCSTPRKLQKKRSFVISSVNQLIIDPELNFEIINLETKRKYSIQANNATEKKQWLDAISKCAKNSRDNSVSLEDQLTSERQARKALQNKNQDLTRRIKDLEKAIEEETSLRKFFCVFTS